MAIQFGDVITHDGEVFFGELSYLKQLLIEGIEDKKKEGDDYEADQDAIDEINEELDNDDGHMYELAWHPMGCWNLTKLVKEKK